MKLAISAGGQGLDARVDDRFGRCPYFVIVDTESMNAESVANPGEGATGGAGIMAAQALAEREVKAVLTGHIGPNAYEVLSGAGIRVFTDVRGVVREAAEAFNRGDVTETAVPTVKGHFGKGSGGRRMQGRS